MRWFAVVLVVVTAGTAAAHPPPELAEEPVKRPAIEWSTWLRLGMGMRPHEVTAATRVTMPQPERRGQDTAYEAALGGELTIGASPAGDVRIGPWFELRGLHDLVAGGELVIQGVPKKIDMFFYEGTGVLALRGGGNTHHLTAQVAYGYLAPWDLFRKTRSDTRYTIGVRLVASYTRSTADPGDWIATVGLETEPVGALRYLLGIRSWY